MIIGLYGYQGCGKSTIANKIAETDSNYAKSSFAEVLRKRLELITPPDVDVYNTEIKNHPQKCYAGRSVRQMLQDDGAYQRSLNQDVFVNSLIKKYEELVVNGLYEYLVVDDLRYFNEYNLITEQTSGLVIKIERANVGPQFGGEEVESEKDWKQFEPDYVVENNSDLLSAVNEIKEIVIHY